MIVTKHLALFLLWNIAVGALLLTASPVIALPWAVGLYLLLLWGYILRPARGAYPGERERLLRLRPLRGQALLWTLISIPVVLMLSWVLGNVYSYFVSVPPEDLNPFEPIMTTPSGRLTIAIFAIGVAPMVEELVFRGLIQRHVEEKRGVAAGIVGAAALFAAIHFLPYIFPLHFVLGLAFGFVVYATNSIWSGVILHAANNAMAMIGLSIVPSVEEPEVATVWESGFSADLAMSLLILALVTALAWWTAQRLLVAGRAQSLEPGEEPA